MEDLNPSYLYKDILGHNQWNLNPIPYHSDASWDLTIFDDYKYKRFNLHEIYE